jgi:hypothetical protein
LRACNVEFAKADLKTNLKVHLKRRGFLQMVVFVRNFAGLEQATGGALWQAHRF